ncbi:MAG: AfsR/SARP family transcriptional regulator [Pseudonocardiaceae bacterium]
MGCLLNDLPSSTPASEDDAGPDRGVRLRLLGGFRLRLDDRTVILPSSEQRVLAFLSIRGRSPRAVVAGTLWSDAVERNALASLRTTLWRLGRNNARLVESSPKGLTLAPAVSVDIHLLAKTALGMVRSPELLDEMTSRNVLIDETIDGAELLPGWYDDWVIFERERMRQVRLHTLEALAGWLTTQRHYGSALEAALESVRIEPLRESAHRAVIAVHLAENNVAEALRHYRFVRDLLRSELGIEPSAQLTAMLPATRSNPPALRWRDAR